MSAFTAVVTAQESEQGQTAETGSASPEGDQTSAPVSARTATTGAGQITAAQKVKDLTIPADCNVTGLAVYVDVDETLVRHYGTRQIPIPSVIKQVKALYKQGAELYCWSSLGAAYARQAAESCGVAQCFQAFLPKPQILVDDQQPKAWRKILHVHPSQCSSQTTVEEYREELKKPRSL